MVCASGPDGPQLRSPGAHLATANLPDNRLVVFVVDSTGRLQSLEVRDRGDWQEPWSQTFAGFAPPGASITVAYQQSDQLDLFVVDSQGRLRVFCWTVPSIWPLPSWVYTLSEPGSAPPGAHIAAAKQGSNQLDVFLINSQGALHILWVVGGGTWSRADLTVGNFAPPGGHVAARQDDLPELDVSIVANSGQQLYWLSVEGQGAWSQPKVIDQLEHAEPGAAVAFLKDPRTGVRQLFFISSRGLEASDEVRQSRSPKWGFPYRIF